MRGLATTLRTSLSIPRFSVVSIPTSATPGNGVSRSTSYKASSAKVQMDPGASLSCTV